VNLVMIIHALGAIHLLRPQKKSSFWPPLTSVHMSWTPSLPCGRPHAVDMKYTPLSWNGYYNDFPDLTLKFDSMIVIYLKLLLVIYITNLHWQKISTFYSVQRRNSGKNDANFFAWEEDRMTSVNSNFNFLCERPHGAWPLYPRPHASTWA